MTPASILNATLPLKGGFDKNYENAYTSSKVAHVKMDSQLLKNYENNHEVSSNHKLRHVQILYK
jgi:hypothetical protein